MPLAPKRGAAVSPRRVASRQSRRPTPPLKTVEKALTLLDFLTVYGGQLGVRELADYLAIDKSSTHRLLTTLERHGYVAQDPVTGKYQLGIRVFEAGAVVLNQINLRAAARPHLERLVQLSHEVVHLAVPSGSQCVYVDRIAGSLAIPMASQIGWRKPLYCTGVGKAILAHLPSARIEEILRAEVLRPLTPHTIVDPERLRAELERIRQEGIAFDDQEIEPGLRCIAAPIRDAHGEIVAGISVAGPVDRIVVHAPSPLADLVREAATAIEHELARVSHQSPGYIAADARGPL